MTGYGETGPMAPFFSFGPLLEAYCGLNPSMGTPARSRCGSARRSPTSSAACTARSPRCAPCRERASTGAAVHVDLSQLETLAVGRRRPAAVDVGHRRAARRGGATARSTTPRRACTAAPATTRGWPSPSPTTTGGGARRPGRRSALTRGLGTLDERFARPRRAGRGDRAVDDGLRRARCGDSACRRSASRPARRSATATSSTASSSPPAASWSRGTNPMPARSASPASRSTSSVAATSPSPPRRSGPTTPPSCAASATPTSRSSPSPPPRVIAERPPW